MNSITHGTYPRIGIVSFALASFFSQFFWSYLVGSFAQATVQTPGVVALNVLFFAPLDDCAGVAAAYDMRLGVLGFSAGFQTPSPFSVGKHDGTISKKIFCCLKNYLNPF